MCSRCYEDTKTRNAAKHAAARAALLVEVPGTRFCLKCKTRKADSEFEVNEDTRKPHLREVPTALCRKCRLYTKAKVREYRIALSPERLAIVAAQKSAANREYRDLLHEAYGGACKCCGENVREFLAIDHVNNDGKEHRKIVGFNAASLYIWAKKHGFPSTLQILCHNCNNAKAFYGVCPHQTQPLLLVKSA